MYSLLGVDYLMYSLLFAVMGMLLAMTLGGLVIFGLHLKKERRPRLALLRESAAFAAFAAGLLGFVSFGLRIYSNWKMLQPMTESYEKFGMPAPSPWEGLLNWPTFAVLAVFLFAFLMVVPRIRRSHLPFLLLVLVMTAFFAYAGFQFALHAKTYGLLLEMAVGSMNIGLWLLAGVLAYISLLLLKLYLLQKKKAG